MLMTACEERDFLQATSSIAEMLSTESIDFRSTPVRASVRSVVTRFGSMTFHRVSRESTTAAAGRSLAH
jgi:hypothetical protein